MTSVKSNGASAEGNRDSSQRRQRQSRQKSSLKEFQSLLEASLMSEDEIALRSLNSPVASQVETHAPTSTGRQNHRNGNFDDEEDQNFVERHVDSRSFSLYVHPVQGTRSRIGKKNGHHYGSNHKRYGALSRHGKADLALNRFSFMFSPSSALCKISVADILLLKSSDIWSHTVCVSSYEVDMICPICLDVVNAGRALPCGHVFCAVCINRCLLAAETDQMLEKCPVCAEGFLARSQLRRCHTRRTETQSLKFILVEASNPTCYPCNANHQDAFACRFQVATGEALMKVIEQERTEIKASQSDFKMFRDSDGLHLLSLVEKEIEKDHIDWSRQLGRSSPVMDESAKSSVVENRGFFYQRADGSLDYLHPLNFKCVLASASQDYNNLPKELIPKEVVEIEEWSEKNLRLQSLIKVSNVHLPDSPLSSRLFEVDLEGMTPEALHIVDKERKDRERKRNDKLKREMKTQMDIKQKEEDMEKRRRQARIDEENLVRAFFGFEQRKADELIKEEEERPPATQGSFSSVVTSMGYFPTLAKSPQGPAKSGTAKSPQTGPVLTLLHMPARSPLQGPQQSAWKSPSALTISPSSSVDNNRGDLGSSLSFAQAASKGPAKKALWQNNPTRRGVW